MTLREAMEWRELPTAEALRVARALVLQADATTHGSELLRSDAARDALAAVLLRELGEADAAAAEDLATSLQNLARSICFSYGHARAPVTQQAALARAAVVLLRAPARGVVAEARSRWLRAQQAFLDPGVASGAELDSRGRDYWNSVLAYAQAAEGYYDALGI